MNWLWLIPLVSFGVFETLALLDRKDTFHPATYWIRIALMLRHRFLPLYWIGLGLYVWLGIHFFVET